MQRLVEDLRARSGCGRSASSRSRRSVHVSGQPDCEERQIERAAVAVAHQHRLQRPSVGGREQRLDRPVARAGLLAQREAREGQLALPAPRAAARAGRSSPRSRRAPRAAHAHTWRARKAGSPRVGERLVEELEVHVSASGLRRCPRLLWLQPMEPYRGSARCA